MKPETQTCKSFFYRNKIGIIMSNFWVNELQMRPPYVLFILHLELEPYEYVIPLVCMWILH